MKTTAESPNPAYIAARYGRSFGLRNLGWNVVTEHAAARTETWFRNTHQRLSERRRSHWQVKPTYHCPVSLLKFRIAPETVIHTWNSGAPHQEHHSKIVQLVPKRCDLRTMIGNDMKSRRELSVENCGSGAQLILRCRQEEASGNAKKEG